MAANDPVVVGLSEKTVNKLRELRRLCVDSAKGFDECAELVSGVGLKNLFLSIARERREMDEALERHIEWNDKHEEEDGSFLGAWHRAWLRLRDALTRKDDPSAVLCEAERGEDTILEAYQDALDNTLGSPIHPLLQAQYASVRNAHDRVRDLANAAND